MTMDLTIATASLASLPAEARDARIVALCDDAIIGLNEARDLDDVLGIRNAAEAFSTYARKLKAAVHAENQCKLVVWLAEERIGRELRAAQDRGEVAERGANQHVRASDTQPATLPEIGIPRQRAADMKALAKAGP